VRSVIEFWLCMERAVCVWRANKMWVRC
jgi:hypothetical protein